MHGVDKLGIKWFVQLVDEDRVTDFICQQKVIQLETLI